MKEFPIKFSFAAVEYSARVVAYNKNAQFHISTFLPELSGIELPFVIHRKKSGNYVWTLINDIPQELGQAIFGAIKKSQKF